MYAEPDEGLGGSPNYSDERRYATFEPEYSSVGERSKNTTQSFIFPQKLDLSTLNLGNKKAPKKKKPSPIKAHHESRIVDHRSAAAKNFTATEKSTDLELLERHFDAITENMLSRSLVERSSKSVRNASITSDRAPSLSSSSTVSGGSQRSLMYQIRCAQQIVDRKANERREEKAKKKKAEDVDNVFSNSDFHLTTDDDETRPPSSQASLMYDEVVVENQRHGGVTSHLISRVTSDGISAPTTTARKSSTWSSGRGEAAAAASTRNAATSTSGFLSDTQVLRVHNRGGRDGGSSAVSSRCSSPEGEDDDDDDDDDEKDKTIVEEVFADTPILRGGRLMSCSAVSSSGSQRIERARDGGHASVSSVVHNVVHEKTMDPRAPHHSLSVLQVSPEKLRELQAHAHLNRSLPNLERFAIRPSTREIFNTPLDIDAICGKGLRRNQKSAEKHFGGAQVAQSVHGRSTRSSGTGSARAPTRPTTSSAAKRREPTRQTAPDRPPYCSAIPTIEGTSYSINTCSQQLLGTVKSLHPDWLPMVRRLLNNTDADVATLFKKELQKMQLALELKYARNTGSSELAGGAHEDVDEDDHRARLCVIFRILERLDELRSHGGSFSRVQQIKLIHSALMGA